jgi:hypothetical protein
MSIACVITISGAVVRVSGVRAITSGRERCVIIEFAHAHMDKGESDGLELDIGIATRRLSAAF